jgi:hypothetical protein
LNGIVFRGALSLNLTVNIYRTAPNLPVPDEEPIFKRSSRYPHRSLLNLAFYCTSFVRSSLSRSFSSTKVTLANRIDLLFVTVLEHSAGRSSDVLFMNVLDKSLSLLLFFAVLALDGREDGASERENRNVFGKKQNNKLSI